VVGKSGMDGGIREMITQKTSNSIVLSVHVQERVGDVREENFQ
jgi:hypothetical protein